MLYPLLVPTYGIALFLYAWNTVLPVPLTYWLLSVGGTLFLTCVCPLTFILLRMKRGEVSDLDISDHKQRTIPFIFSMLSMILWCYMGRLLAFPLTIQLTNGAAVLVLALVTLINTYWKISVHLASFACLLSGIAGYMLNVGPCAYWPIILMLIMALLLMYARVYIEAHTPQQTVAGFLLGLIISFIPQFILFILSQSI